MHFGKCIQLSNHRDNQETEYFHHSKIFLGAHFQKALGGGSHIASFFLGTEGKI